MAREMNSNHGLLASSLRRQGIEQRSAPERNRLYQLDATTFQQIDTEAKAYWLGFLFADGTITKRTVTLCLSHKDRSQVEAFRDFLKSEAPVKDVVKLVNTLSSLVHITDRYLVADLQRLGIAKGRPNPLIGLINTPAHLEHHWIRGFFDGDGSATAGKAGLSFCCPQKELLESLKRKIADGIGREVGSFTKHKSGSVWYLSYAGYPSCTAVANYLYRDATVYLDRKRQRTLNWKQPAPDSWVRPLLNGRFVKADSVLD